MKTVYCFSGSGHSMAVARKLAEMLDCEVKSMDPTEGNATEEIAAVIFPVYCQNIPKPVKQFLKRLKAKQIALIATYGKISYGNVLYEGQRIVKGEIIAGAYIPIGHTFLNGGDGFDPEYLIPIAQRIAEPQSVRIPKARKNPLSDVFPGLRSRLGVKLERNSHCNHCGLCEKACFVGAMHNGRTHSNCIRCLHCVTVCPQKALQYKNSWILQTYLTRHNKEAYVLYL